MTGIDTLFYQLEQQATGLLAAQLNGFPLLALAAAFGAGLVTSLSPCTLSMLPVTLGYIGGYAAREGRALSATLWFGSGFATTLTGFGLVAAGLGRLYGQVSGIWPLLMGAIAIAMGLQLLGVWQAAWPDGGRGIARWAETWPGGARAYGLGLSFGLASSPCSTPVTVALLGWLSTTGKVWLGGALLLAYALGSAMPLVLAGASMGWANRLFALRQQSSLVPLASGALLIGFGTLTILNRLAALG
ncbi:MAG: cytochrome c biogenesis protein CcdA [Oscillatoriales cyanobacterium SM2_1_8]|nr:cytochrome c biogenesis protein CcdA [Oscillatoriales cyanobacterium SM2_1_8]